MAQKTKVAICCALSLLLFGSGFFAGRGVYKGRAEHAIEQYAAAQGIIAELREQEARDRETIESIASRNADLTRQLAAHGARVETARVIISSTGGEISDIGELAEDSSRIIRGVICALSVIFEGWQD